MDTLQTQAQAEIQRQTALKYEQAKRLVLDAVRSPNTKRAYNRALDEFIAWHTATGQATLTKAVVNSYRQHMIDQGKANSVINQALSAIRKLAREAADNGLLDDTLANGIRNVKGVSQDTLPAGRRLTAGEIEAMIRACGHSPIDIRDAAILALLYMCGLRRAELVALDLADYDPDTHDLKVRHAKGDKQRQVPVGNGARAALADWLVLRGQTPGALFSQVLKGGHIKRTRLTMQAIWHVVQKRADQAGVRSLTPHDFRRTFISDLLATGADISIVAKLAGHSDVSTTARYDHRDEKEMRQATNRLHLPYTRRYSA